MEHQGKDFSRQEVMESFLNIFNLLAKERELLIVDIKANMDIYKQSGYDRALHYLQKLITKDSDRCAFIETNIKKNKELIDKCLEKVGCNEYLIIRRFMINLGRVKLFQVIHESKILDSYSSISDLKRDIKILMDSAQ